MCGDDAEEAAAALEEDVDAEAADADDNVMGVLTASST